MKNFLISFFVLLFAFSVLGISVFRSASVSYDFSDNSIKQAQNVLGESTSLIDYYLPYPGKILPDSPVWPLKATRDKVWLFVTTNPTREAEMKLLFADKRLGMAKVLFEEGNPEVGLTVLTKAEKYLEEASSKEKENRDNGFETMEFLGRLTTASLKHYEVMEYLLTIAPEGARPAIVSSQNYAKKTHEVSRNALLEKGITPPENPFNWQ